MKQLVCTLTALLGAAIAALFGGWNEGMTVLCVLMALDYCSGICLALIFRASPKTPGGGLESRTGWKGLFRKLFTLALVAAAHMIDRLVGTNYIRDAAAIAFALNEVISILENAGLMGIPIPGVLQKGLELLRQKTGESENRPQGPRGGA